MLLDNAAVSGAAEYRTPVHTIGHRPRARSVDLHAVADARRGFEGLIINRGRPLTEDLSSSPIAHGRTRAAARVAQLTALQVGIAESLEQIEAANRLVCQRYSWRGYNLEAFDVESLSVRGVHGEEGEEPCHEITFFVADPQAIRGTITLRLDGPEGLRAESTHPERLQYARADGRRLGELTRLAIADGVGSRQVLASLFGLVYAVGRMVHGVTDVFIEVNPRHVTFYSRALGFAVAGDARFCERVCAPSVLLHLDVEILDEQLGFTDPTVPDEAVMRFGT